MEGLATASADEVNPPARRPGQGLDAGGMEIIWRCTECGCLQSRGDDLPEACPCCGAPREVLVLVEED